MTTGEYLTMFIMPIGGVVMALIILFLTRHERRVEHK